ncbi:sigma-70 family RNA polymerase sigma factor [Ignavibacteria bacterium]|nr:sigma-70 family RNA polymerase sigma factor [Bacteroidota bacterium]MCZ2132811.1 sigma-70 family RNA polymerase sigma factor [Bacteroidota bacterium]
MSDYALNSDEELFNLVKKNDERAFRALYQRYSKRIYAYCLRIVGVRTAADDVFQTVFTAVYEKRETFTGGSFSAWIFTIARNFSLKARNQQKVVLSKIEALDNYTDYLPDESDHTGDDIYIRDALRAAIASLSEEFRETIELRYFEELSYEEIAEVLGIGIPLAKIRVFRAKQQLQKILTPYIREIR